MLHFENGRFRQNGVSFVLPDEFYFETCHDEDAVENGIRVLSRDENYYIQWAIFENCESTNVELETLLTSDDGTDRVISPLEEIECNGLHGHQAYYTFAWDKKQYFEMRLALPDDLQFALMIETEEDILALVQSDEIQSLLREIRAE